MKQITFILIIFVSILFYSCTKETEKSTDGQKKFTLPEKYEKISEPGLVYVSHISSNFVSVFDPAEMKLIGQIPCGNGSDCSMISSDGKKGYITNFNSNDVTIYDTKTNKTIVTLPAGKNPTFLLEIPAEKKVLVSHQSNGGLNVINTADNSITQNPEICTGPLYYIKALNKIYQPQIFQSYLYILDPVTLNIMKKIETGGRPMEMAFTNNQKYGYMVNYDSSEIAKFDINRDTIILKIKNILSPRGIASSPDNKYLFVTNVKDNSVTVIDAGKDTVIKTLEGFSMPTSVVITGDGKYAVVSNQGAAKLFIIDILKLEVTKSIDVASNPIYLMVDIR